MKAILLAALLALPAHHAAATGLAETLVDPEVIVDDTRAAGSGGFIVPLLLIAVIAVVTTTGGGGDPAPKVPILGE